MISKWKAAQRKQQQLVKVAIPKIQAIVDLKEIETSINKSVSPLLQNFVGVLNTHFTETGMKHKIYVCSALGKFTVYGGTFF